MPLVLELIWKDVFIEVKLTGRGTRRHNGAVEAGLGDNVDLNRGVATRVIDVAGVNFGDRHRDWF